MGLAYFYGFLGYMFMFVHPKRRGNGNEESDEAFDEVLIEVSDGYYDGLFNF